MLHRRSLAVLLIGLLALWSWLAPTPASAQDQEPDLAAYTNWVREAFAAAQRQDRIGLEAVAGRLIATTAVRLPDGATISVDNSWLRQSMDATSADLPAIAERLGAIIDALAQPESAAPDDARARLALILSRPPFQRNEPDPQRWRWLRAVLEWLGRLIDELLRPVDVAPGGAGTTIAWGIGIVGAALLIGVIAYLLLGLRRNMVARAAVHTGDPEAGLTARSALDQAGELARGGDYRTAVRYLYLSALLWLDERDLLRYDRALTNREYLERVRDNPTLRAQLAPIVETFDRVWYGHAALDAAAFAAYQEQVEALRAGR